VENFSYTQMNDEDVTPRHKPHPRFRRLSFHLAGAKELDIPSEMKLVARAQDKSRPQAAARAMQTLIANHMSFLQGIAAKVAVKNNMIGAEDDLESEAIFSFIRTVQRYQGEAYGARLATFATYTVSGDVMNYALRNRNAYAVGTSSQDRKMIYGFEDFIDTFKIQHKTAFDQDNPTHIKWLAEIAEVSGTCVRRTCAQRRAGTALNIDDIEIEDMDVAGPEQQMLQKSTADFARATLEEVRSKLNKRDRMILDALLSDTPEDYASLARRYYLTSERVGQIYRSAISDIKDRLQRAGVTSA
jgi:RNA polymerase sigma factor (sigma-70 family)